MKRTTTLLGDASNLLILFELMQFGEKSFNELKRMTGINPVTLSKKLSVLKEGDFVSMHKQGNENHYTITERAELLRPIMAEIKKLVI